uniref:Uncharacterized protein n=1 Tax=Mycena chlorophos TaxID=658473 RepID=A0ABQ0LEX4_MYCCL|nr:predicted protein [Mycena chlorophos]
MRTTHILSLVTLATSVSASWQSLGIPASSTGATLRLSVQAFNVGNLTIGTATQIVHPVVQPGPRNRHCPNLRVLVEAQGRWRAHHTPVHVGHRDTQGPAKRSSERGGGV